MTAAELISRYDAERPNQISPELKLEWLQKLEKLIIREVILTHSGDERFTPETAPGEERAEPFDEDAYFADWGLASDLIADVPYDDVYIYYIDLRAAINANDTKRYNLSTNLYNNAMVTFQQYYNRTYRPVRKRKRFYRHENL